MDKCKEYEATVRDYIAMASDNPQLQTAYQKGTAIVDNNNFKRSRFQGRRIGNRNRSSSHSGSRECKTLTCKCKQSGFTKHTTSDGSCPAIKVTWATMNQFTLKRRHNRTRNQEEAKAARTIANMTATVLLDIQQCQDPTNIEQVQMQSLSRQQNNWRQISIESSLSMSALSL